MSLGWMEIVVILLVVLLLFGAKKIPELMKNMGKGVRSFKDGLKEGMDANDESDNVKPDDKLKS